MRFSRQPLSLAIALAGALSASATMTLAQGLEEVVVTANKRATSLQDVPLAVSVVDAQIVQRSEIRDLLDLQSVVPSLRVPQFQNSVQTNFVIRGFGNGANNPGIEPSVAVFIDGVYRSRSLSRISDLPNIEQIEVLRGPQSTLYGKNASAGVILVNTANQSSRPAATSRLAPATTTSARSEATLPARSPNLLPPVLADPCCNATATSITSRWARNSTSVIAGRCAAS